MREKVTSRLRTVGLDFQGKAVVRHLIEVLHDDVTPARISGLVTRPLRGLKIAVHYGCHMMRPADRLHFDDPLHPEKYDPWSGRWGRNRRSTRPRCSAAAADWGLRGPRKKPP